MHDHRILAGRRALITGSMGGLGKTMAEALAAAGADVMLSGLAPPSEAEQLRQAIAAAHGVRAGYCQADLSHRPQVEMLVESAMKLFGGVDILINNAVVRHFSPIETFPTSEWENALAVNVSAAFYAIRLLLPAMKQSGYGRIVNMTSVYGSRGVANRIDYVTTKTALQGLTRGVATEVGDGDVTCNALCPGSVMTPNADQRVNDIVQSEGISRQEAEARFLTGKQPKGRFIAAESVAAMLLVLCGPAGRDINGAMLPIEGGWLAS